MEIHRPVNTLNTKDVRIEKILMPSENKSYSEVQLIPTHVDSLQPRLAVLCAGVTYALIWYKMLLEAGTSTPENAVMLAFVMHFFYVLLLGAGLIKTVRYLHIAVYLVLAASQQFPHMHMLAMACLTFLYHSYAHTHHGYRIYFDVAEEVLLKHFPKDTVIEAYRERVEVDSSFSLVKHLKTAAEQDDAVAHFALSRMYLLGVEVGKNQLLGLDHLCKSTQLGDQRSYRLLLEMAAKSLKSK